MYGLWPMRIRHLKYSSNESAEQTMEAVGRNRDIASWSAGIEVAIAGMITANLAAARNCSATTKISTALGCFETGMLICSDQKNVQTSIFRCGHGPASGRGCGGGPL